MFSYTNGIVFIEQSLDYYLVEFLASKLLASKSFCFNVLKPLIHHFWHPVLQRSWVAPISQALKFSLYVLKFHKDVSRCQHLMISLFNLKTIHNSWNFFPVMYLIISSHLLISPTSPFTCLLVGCL